MVQVLEVFFQPKLSGAVKRCFKGLAFQELGLAPAPFSGQHRADESASPACQFGRSGKQKRPHTGA